LEARRPRHLERRFAVIDSRADFGIRAAREKTVDRKRIPLGDSHVERGVVVDAALMRIGAECQQHAYDLVDVRPPGRARLRTAADECGIRAKPSSAELEDRRRSGGVRMNASGPCDRVDEARSDRVVHARPVRNRGLIVHGRARLDRPSGSGVGSAEFLGPAQRSSSVDWRPNAMAVLYTGGYRHFTTRLPPHYFGHSLRSIRRCAGKVGVTTVNGLMECLPPLSDVESVLPLVSETVPAEPNIEELTVP
jgi:hypothetical protein